MAHLLKFLFPEDESFGFEALRAAAYANCGGADIGEVIQICSRIPAGDTDCWLLEWQTAADRAVANANTSLTKGNTPAAREAFLRASNYYRTAEFYRRDNPWADDLSNKLADLSSEMFYKATRLMRHVTEKVKIPYEGTTLPGILMRPDNSDTLRPLIIVNGGFDSTMEEVSYSVGATALELGMNVLAFDGPGQGSAVRHQKLLFHPDWEKVVTPVVDYCLAQPFVKKNKIALIGISMGGYLAARASAFEHRLAAVVLNDGVFDFGSVFRKGMDMDNSQDGGPQIGNFLISNEWDDEVNAFIRKMQQENTGTKWALSNAKWVFGVDSEVEAIRRAQKYTMEAIIDQVKTPTLVLDAPDDHFLKGQPEEIYKKLQCEKDLITITQEEGGSLHCHIGAGSRLAQVTFDWLLEKLSS
ncbi:dipeptidyl aminopeptidase/acylaminoacyl peptidase [Basidiobolus meristosporus CBS 931.73]|uniref:Dipeptidyl aminopeptidase/acylaminoacyl peptidase n=1 Tax=Basidiobolus meristosporus CBS 931.73 TaxID=1314790 RepID=A0A1Y1XU15_9FUNG|nr:dipeptidyl aminopeptidase/acylaminoacyl peptidase [Basidiobolus meristosporus CBS 931.73]|eukprot:ORX89213.1 dipeptidyl aminopeptidase/acylaminoacyl peptidase [Basidiobolus meristosporus CBS 931.73]